MWERHDGRWTTALGSRTAEVTLAPLRIAVRDGGRSVVATAGGDAYPCAPLAARRDGRWERPCGAADVAADGTTLRIAWTGGIALTLTADGDALAFGLSADGADAVCLAFASRPDERYHGLGERFDRLDQRGKLVDLWVINGASGGDTYKPVPWVASSEGWGLALDTSFRVHCALAHPTVPDVAGVTVHAGAVAGRLLFGATPAELLGAYTAWIGRPPIPPDWALRPWKSRDWRVETQQTVIEDLVRQQEHRLPCGVKLIDATWESDEHSFAFDPAKYPDPEGMLRRLREAGLEVVLWISPSMTDGCPAHAEAARRGFLLRDPSGAVYRHRLGNQPGWYGTTVDFTNPEAVAWWQERIRSLMELGVRGIKTDFGEQVPADAVAWDGRTGAELHNLLPVLYNRATWEVVRQYDGILLARSAWAGSQPMPAIWAGDQSSDGNPWSGLPSVIVAAQSAGWSGFPYWGSDVGGYFGTPTTECFARWAQFAALTPIMQVHGLGPREPWDFGEPVLSIYREYAELHTRLVPYALSLAREARETGLPLVRALALMRPDEPGVHADFVQYQYLYGDDLLVAPLYFTGLERIVHFPAGEWIEFFDGARIAGPRDERVRVPLERLPLYVRAGAVLPLAADVDTPWDEALELRVHPDAAAGARHRLPDGTEIVLHPAEGARARLTVAGGPARRYVAANPHGVLAAVRDADGRALDGGAWTGPADLTLELR